MKKGQNTLDAIDARASKSHIKHSLNKSRIPLILIVITITMLFLMAGCKKTPTPTPTVSEIEIDIITFPSMYIVGEQFPSGAKLNATLSDGSKSSVDLTSDLVTGFDTSLAGIKTLEIKYEGLSINTTITVLGLSEISISSFKYEYTVGESFLDGNLNATFTYAENSLEMPVIITEDMVEGFDTSNKGVQSVKISYKGQSIDTYIYVGLVIDKVVIDADSFKTSYELNTSFSNTSKLKVNFTEQSYTAQVVSITEDMLSAPFSSATPGRKALNIAFLDKTITTEVVVTGNVTVDGFTLEYIDEKYNLLIDNDAIDAALIEDFEFEYGYFISKYDGNKSDVIIPNEYSEIPVICIAPKIFLNHHEIKSMSLSFFGFSPQSQGDFRYLFDNHESSDDALEYKNLKTVTILPGITEIPESALGFCFYLQNIYIPNTVKVIKESAFAACVGLTSLTIPSSVETIEEDAFGYTVLSLILESEEVLQIDVALFSDLIEDELTVKFIIVDDDQLEAYKTDEYWKNLKDSIAPKSSFSTVDGFLIKDNNYLVGYSGDQSTITVPSGITTIGKYAFMYNTGVERVIFPSSVSLISRYSFSNAQTLNAVELTEGLLTIEDFAFVSASQLKSLTIPSTVTSIGQFALATFGETVFIFKTAPLTITDDIFDESTIILVPEEHLSAYKSAAILSQYADRIYPISSIQDDYLIDTDGTTLIKYFGTDSEVTLPDYISVIGENAFYTNTVITKITIHKNVTSIGKKAFAYCSNLNTVSIAEDSNMTSIGESAFHSTTNLTWFKIPHGVTQIQIQTFNYSGLVEICIPKNITSIDGYAFAGCENLESLIFDDESKLEIIGSSAFSKTKKLVSITLPIALKSIQDYAFDASPSLKEISIGANIQNIGRYVFLGNTNLEEIYIDLETLDGVTLGDFWNFTDNYQGSPVYANVRLKEKQS